MTQRISAAMNKRLDRIKLHLAQRENVNVTNKEALHFGLHLIEICLERQYLDTVGMLKELMLRKSL